VSQRASKNAPECAIFLNALKPIPPVIKMIALGYFKHFTISGNCNL